METKVHTSDNLKNTNDMHVDSNQNGTNMTDLQNATDMHLDIDKLEQSKTVCNPSNDSSNCDMEITSKDQTESSW